MDEITALHTAARSYCQKEFSEWMGRYSSLMAAGKVQVPRQGSIGWDYTEEAYQLFPRYRIAQAIQVEVERIIPSDAKSVEDLRAFLLKSAQSAQDKLSAELKNLFAKTAIAKEADEYRKFLRGLTKEDLDAVQALPYRRVLIEQESERIWAGLKDRWDIGGNYWFPLRECDPPSDVMPFHEECFHERHGLELLRKVLAERGIIRVFQLHEFGSPDYEVELSIFEPRYAGGGEQYSTSKSLDWLVYASHESSITIAGDWLSAFFRGQWPDWKERTYQGPYSTADLRGTWEAK
jgi:hypothetical protein